MNIIDNISISRSISKALNSSADYSENTIYIDNGSDYRMKLDEIKLDNMLIGLGKYYSQEEHIISVKSKVDCILSHFCLFGESVTNADEQKIKVNQNEFGLFYKKDESVTHTIPRTGDEGGLFFQITIPKESFRRFYMEESQFMNELGEAIAKGKNFWVGQNLNILPEMRILINEMRNPIYTGKMKKLYLEAKLTEVLLCQVNAFDSMLQGKNSRLKLIDKDSIHSVRSFLENNIDTEMSIIDLSRMVGINQTKLKKGFKELFGTTVFGYLTDLRMEHAKHLLLDEKKYVGEVAALVGYQHPHHFSAAFKRKFGFSPKELKE